MINDMLGGVGALFNGGRPIGFRMKVTERFDYESPERVIYSFTVEDPSVWTAPFSGEYSWPKTDNKVFEYACHEANYALEGIMKGARVLEMEYRGEDPGGVANPTN